jgi:hypothetical protein
LNDRVVGDAGADKTLYMWAFEWWPFALGSGRNPLDVDVAWAPDGFDFGLGTAGGGLALVATPLTEAFGPVATYNVLVLAAPALAATTAFLLVRQLTAAFAPALVGGWLFGFSSYELGHLLGHLPLAFTALVPLVPYLVLRRHARRLTRWRFVALVGAVLVCQFLIVPQTFVTLSIVGAIAAIIAAAVLGLGTVRRLAAETAAGWLAALVVLSPVLAYAIVSDAAAPRRSPFSGAADLLNYVVPTRRTWLRPPGSDEISSQFTGAGAEHGAYLGLPLLLLVGLAAIPAFRRPPSRPRLVLVLLLVSVVLLSLGTRIKIAGDVIGIGPWSALAPFPILGSALPIRMTMYGALLAALLAGLALADRRSITRWAIAALGLVAIFPNLALPQWSAAVERPGFFARGGYERYLGPDSTALVLPYGPSGWSMLWQAEASFGFRLVGGHFALRATPSEEEWRDVYEALGTGGLRPARLREFLAAHEVDAVVVAPETPARVRRLVAAAVDTPPVRVLDTLVYRLGSRP